jgi:hypothetical protein
MKTTGIAAFVMLAAPATAAPLPASFVPPGGSAYVLPEGVDHVAVMTVKEGGRPAKQITLFRHGTRQRQDILEGGHAYAVYTDMQTGLAWHVSRNPDGRPAALGINGSSERDRMAVRKTSQNDWRLGRFCAVWEMKPARDGGTWSQKACVTDDGVLLWQKTFYSDGSLMSEARASKITRRRVTTAEVSPPADALSLSSYGDWTPGQAALPNDETVLQGPNPPPDTPAATMLVRRLGALTLTDSRTVYGRTRRYDNATYTLSVTEKPDGSLDGLQIVPRRDPSMWGPPQAFKPAKFAVILGRRCQIYDMAPRVQDYGETQCRTADGLILSKATWSWGRGTPMSAVSLRQRLLKLADLVPPADILTGMWKGLGGLPKPPPPPEPPKPPVPKVASWSAFPRASDYETYYPRRAADDEIEGSATVECTAPVTGFVPLCKAVSETPAGYGFGAATVRMMEERARLKPGTFKSGDLFRHTVRWHLP